jgi:inhibitor of cysteine peptidase
MTLTKADDGRVVSLNAGDAITIELPGNPSAGYQWALEGAADGALRVAPSGFQPAGTGVGGGGIERWVVTSRDPGQARLMFKYWRPWAGESSIVDRFVLTIDVAAAA